MEAETMTMNNGATEPKPARERGANGLFKRADGSESTRKPKEPTRKIEYIGVEKEDGKKPSTAKPAGSSKPRSGPVEKMTPKKTVQLLTSSCAIASFVMRNPGYALTPDDVANSKELIEQITEGFNAMPDWLRGGIAQGSSSIGLFTGLGIFFYQKHLMATGQLSWELLRDAQAQAQAQAAPEVIFA